MNLNKIAAIFQKQVKDSVKNKTVLIQFILFPIMTVIMTNTVTGNGIPENYFVTMFASMYLVMAPITSMAAIIAEEKEKNTLRVLLMSNVKPMQYLFGVGSYVFCICLMGSMVFAILGNYQGTQMVLFLGFMIVGIVISILMGAAIGAWSKNQMMATSITLPIILVFSFLPMLSTYNDSVKKFSVIVYSQQVNTLINELGDLHVNMENLLIIGVNIFAILGLFIYAYRKNGLS